MGDYLRPDALLGWLQNCLHDHPSGLLWLQMPRSSGKTVFARSLDHTQSGNLDLHLDDCTTRGCFLETSYHGEVEDFVIHLGEIFNRDSQGEPLFHQQEILLNNFHPDLGSDILYWDFIHILSAYQGYYKQYYGTQKLLLVIDGLESLTDKHSLALLELLGTKPTLIKDCYILLVSRPLEELHPGLKNLLKLMEARTVGEFPGTSVLEQQPRDKDLGAFILQRLAQLDLDTRNVASQLLLVLAGTDGGVTETKEGLNLAELALITQTSRSPEELRGILNQFWPLVEGWKGYQGLRYALQNRVWPVIHGLDKTGRLHPLGSINQAHELRDSWLSRLANDNTIQALDIELQAGLLVWLREALGNQGGVGHLNFIQSCKRVIQGLVNSQDSFFPKAWPLRQARKLNKYILTWYQQQSTRKPLFQEGLAEAYFLQAQLYQSSHLDTKALDCCTHALDLLLPLAEARQLQQPEIVARVYGQRGLAYHHQQNQAQAREDYCQAIEYLETVLKTGQVRWSLHLAEAWTMRALFETWAFMYDEAELAYQKALSIYEKEGFLNQPLDPVIPTILLDRAMNLSLAKHSEKALVQYNHAYEIITSNKELHPSISKLLAQTLRSRAYLFNSQLERPKEALVDYEELCRLYRSGQLQVDTSAQVILYSEMVYTYTKLQQFENVVYWSGKALEILEEERKKGRLLHTQKMCELYYQRSQAYYQLGECQLSLRDVNSAIDIAENPGSLMRSEDLKLTLYKLSKAQLLYYLQQYDQALVLLKSVLLNFEIADYDCVLKNSRPQWAEAFLLRGRILLEQGQFGAAASDFSWALEHFSTSQEEGIDFDGALKITCQELLHQAEKSIREANRTRR